jgi:hypothetical protein
VTNTGSASAAVHLEVDFDAYATPKTQDVTVSAKASKRFCLTPTFDITALYALTAPVTGMVEGHAHADSNEDLGSVNRVVSVPPVSDIAWTDPPVPSTDMRTLASVYVEPNAPVMDQLQRLAQQSSVFSNFGNGDPYSRDPYARTVSLDPAHYTSELFFVEPGEPLQWLLAQVTCSGCSNPDVDVYLLTPDQMDAWTQGTGSAATAVWPGQESGAKQSQSLAPGFYNLVLFNNDASSGRDIVWARSVTREDVVRDLLTSVFSALRSLGVTYTSVTGTYFDDWQHVRRVGESIQALSANCIDGSLVFASVAELLGVEPVLIFKTGHAYMGVRSAPGSSIIWPIETTMVGNASASPWDAYLTGMYERVDDAKMDPAYQEIDLATMRDRGITPLVQQ